MSPEEAHRKRAKLQHELEIDLRGQVHGEGARAAVAVFFVNEAIGKTGDVIHSALRHAYREALNYFEDHGVRQEVLDLWLLHTKALAARRGVR